MVTIKILDDPPMRFWHSTCSQCMWTAYADASDPGSYDRLYLSSKNHNSTHKTTGGSSSLWKKLREKFI